MVYHPAAADLDTTFDRRAPPLLDRTGHVPVSTPTLRTPQRQASEASAPLDQTTRLSTHSPDVGADRCRTRPSEPRGAAGGSRPEGTSSRQPHDTQRTTLPTNQLRGDGDRESRTPPVPPRRTDASQPPPGGPDGGPPDGNDSDGGGSFPSFQGRPPIRRPPGASGRSPNATYYPGNGDGIPCIISTQGPPPQRGIRGLPLPDKFNLSKQGTDPLKFKQWTTKMRNYLDLAAIDPSMQARVVSSGFLVGHADRQADEFLTAHEDATVDELFASLRRLVPGHNPMVSTQKLETLRFNRHKWDLPEFLQEITDLQREINEGEPLDDGDWKLIRTNFVKKLPADMQKYVMLRGDWNKVDAQTCLAWAKQYEINEQSQRASAKSKEPTREPSSTKPNLRWRSRSRERFRSFSRDRDRRSRSPVRFHEIIDDPKTKQPQAAPRKGKPPTRGRGSGSRGRGRGVNPRNRSASPAQRRFSRSPSNSSRQSGRRTPQSRSPTGRSSSTCYGCGEPGHFIKDCKNPKTASNLGPCFTCNKKGHLSRDCPDKAARTSELHASDDEEATAGLAGLVRADVDFPLMSPDDNFNELFGRASLYDSDLDYVQTDPFPSWSPDQPMTETMFDLIEPDSDPRAGMLEVDDLDSIPTNYTEEIPVLAVNTERVTDLPSAPSAMAPSREEHCEQSIMLEGLVTNAKLDTGASATLFPRWVLQELLDKKGKDFLKQRELQQRLVVKTYDGTVVRSIKQLVLEIDDGKQRGLVPCLVDSSSTGVDGIRKSPLIGLNALGVMGYKLVDSEGLQIWPRPEIEEKYTGIARVFEQRFGHLNVLSAGV